MKDQILKNLAAHFTAKINLHKTNVEIMLANPMSIHEHTDYMKAVEMEIEVMAEYMDKLEVLEQHFI